MNIDEEYRLGIKIARNQWVMRNTDDPHLKAHVARETQSFRCQLAGGAA